MSKHHVSHTVVRVLNDVRNMPKQDLEELYGLEIRDDGTVYDLAEFTEFASLQKWATFFAEQQEDENYSTFTKIGGKHAFDDEY